MLTRFGKMLNLSELLGISILEWMFFAIISLYPGYRLLKRLDMPSHLLPLVSLVVVGFFGWINFWCFFSHPYLGYGFSIVLAVSSSYFFISSAVRPNSEFRTCLIDPDVLLPFLLLFFALIAYNSYLYLPDYGNSIPLEDYPQKRFFGSYSSDNTLPLLFASKLAHGETLKPFYSDWLSSDRPPLQTGIVLLQWFIAESFDKIGLAYQISASLLQLSWIFVVWALCRIGSLRPEQTLFLLLCCFTNPGFFLVHSIYVWPKMIAGSFISFAIILLFFQQLTFPRMLIAGMSISFGMLSHGGVIFTLIAVGMILVFQGRIKQSGYLASSAGVAFLGYLPWFCYQKFYDPPGHRLVKWHIAGQIPIDNRGIWQSLKESYAALPLNTIIENKVSNLKFLVRGWDNWIVQSDPVLSFEARLNQFYSHAQMLGILNIGIILLPWMLYFFRKDGRTKQWLVLSLLACLGTLLWSILIFIPEQNIIHQGSFSTTLMVILVSGWALSFLPQVVRVFIVSFQFLQLIFVWMAPTTTSVPLGRQWLYGSLLAGVVGIGYCLKRMATTSHNASTK